MIYFDNSATTKPFKEVLDTYVTVSENYFANPSSIHCKGGETERLIHQARKMTASLLHVKPSEIIFTSGGTEGNNLAIKGIALKHSERGKHLITTMTEHAATFESFKYLESIGFDVTYLPVDEKGRISLEKLEKSMRKDTILVSIMHVNNEVGTIQPILEAGNIIRKYPKAFFHVDNVQGITKVPLSLKEAHIDLCTMSGHKFHGLKGTGILYVREGVTLSPLFTGGSQEGKLRAGTENVAGIVATVKALRMSFDQMKPGVKKMEQIKRFLINELSHIPGVLVNTPETHSAPHIVNFSVENMKPEVLIHSLEENNVFVSTRSACSSKQGGASRVLVAMGFNETRATNAIRISLAYQNTMEEAERFIELLKESISKLQEVMR
ncbi:cysteine desulfurase family protein [Fictibacillus sp. Mic-4]|uniref:cysteine desulfurase family protein n=1 Tax=Fictibacillus sp. Mic-4 TaxID=3132826 RepID=UPI003CF83617